MGNPAYDALREAERIEAERDAAMAEAGKNLFAALADIAAGRAAITWTYNDARDGYSLRIVRDDHGVKQETKS